jgi:predicted transcriptional regulator YdeE
MKKQIVNIGQILFVGLQTRTKNEDEFNPQTAKISDLVMNQYFGKESYNRIIDRKNPALTMEVYNNYESDYTGQYDYTIGEEVTSFNNIPEGFVQLEVPAGTYCKFIIQPGPMPQTIIEAWQRIWQMNEKDFGGKRKYDTDFVIYRESGAEIYLGVDVV